MKKRSNIHIAFDKDFYIVQAIINSKKFLKLDTEFKGSLSKIGLQIPNNWFKTVAEYHEWGHKADEKLVGYYSMVDKILDQFGLYTEEEHDMYRLGIFAYLFFGSKRSSIKPNHKIGRIPSEGEEAAEISITIFPWTKVDEIHKDLQLWIPSIQRQMKSYHPRNKEWKTFERDFSVYELFLRVSQDLKNGRKIEPAEESNSPYSNIAYYPEFEAISKKYGYKTGKLDSRVREIVSECNVYFKSLKLL